jgi:hypothetical protein
VLFGDLVDGGRVDITVVDDKLNFEVSKILSKEEKKALKREAALLEEQNVQDQVQQ